MRNLLFATGISLLTACGNNYPPSNPTDVDSTFASEPEQVALLEESVYESYAYRTFIRSKFTRNQISDSYFVFDPEGLDGETADSVIHFDAGSSLIVTSEFSVSKADERRNATGYLYEIGGEENRVVVSSACLLQMPYPKKKYTSLQEYALNELHIVDSLLTGGERHKTDPNGAHEGTSETNEYFFEKNITLQIYYGYEVSTETLFIPHLNAQQGFYFMNALGIIDLFAAFEGKIPSDFNKEFLYTWKDTEMICKGLGDDNGRLISISIRVADDGCGEWIDISEDLPEDGRGIFIEMGSGC